MKNTLRYGFGAILVFGLVFSCAKRGFPTGGPKDLDPPEFVGADPENYSTNFEGRKIRIYFDEYLTLEEPHRQILISPPMDPPAIITPMGTPRKYVEIEIRDTLQKNTTYTVNFGQSIQDNNEGNILTYFKYVFSTGDYIDSLSVSGFVQDAILKSPDKFISVMLYDLGELKQGKTFGRATAYTDSIPYIQLPTYISYTNDSLHSFKIENIKEGTYKLIALKDFNSNYLFDPGVDKIGFLEEPIQIPTDSAFYLTLFKEIPDFEFDRPKQEAQQHLIFGYKGIADSVQIKLLSEKPENFEQRIVQDDKTDTLHYWYKPDLKRDSLVFEVSNPVYRDTLTAYLRELKKDTLRLDAKQSGFIGFEEAFIVEANIPIVEKDTSQIRVLNKDSLLVNYSAKIDYRYNYLELEFEKEEAQTYYINLLPGAVTDFFGNVNDTLNYRLQTKELSDYGILTLNLQNIKSYPILVQLVSLDGETVKETYASDGQSFTFQYIEPAGYFVRIIYDENKNGKWDTGDYLENRQAERVEYFPDTLEIRANWDVVQRVDLD